MTVAAVLSLVMARGYEKGKVFNHVDFESKILGNRRQVSVYTPSGYGENQDRAYQVVYFMDGQNVFDGDRAFIKGSEWRADETADGLIGAGLIPPMILVAVDNAGASRADEYLMSRRSFRGQEMGGKGADFLKFMVEEIMPFVGKNYRVKAGAENCGVVGSSFGGLIALSMGLERPDVFGKLGVCSPSIWWDDREMLKRIGRFSGTPRPKIWLDMGLKEGQDMVNGGGEALVALRSHGWNARDSVLFEEADAEHNEKAWSGRLPLLLRWLFGE